MFTTRFLDIPPLAGIGGTVRVPGSKSISNRALLLAGFAEGTTSDLGPAPLRRHPGDAGGADPARLPHRGRRRAARGHRHRRAPARPADDALARQRRNGDAAARRRASPSPRRPAPGSSSAARRACTSGRSATWSTRCARSAARSTTSASPAFRRSWCERRRAARARPADRRPRRRLEPVPHLAAARPAAACRRHRRGRSRSRAS